jgi:hypothetical protein
MTAGAIAATATPEQASSNEANNKQNGGWQKDRVISLEVVVLVSENAEVDRGERRPL